MSLPHLQEFDETPIERRVEELQKENSLNEIYLAVSDGFWEPEEQEQYESILNAYNRFYSEIVSRLSTLLCEPTLRRSWSDPDFPDWAVGLSIAAWTDHAVPFYVRLEHEDREVPIIVALAAVTSE